MVDTNVNLPKTLVPTTTNYSSVPVKTEPKHSTAVGHDYTTSEKLGDTEKTASNVGVPILANPQRLEVPEGIQFEPTPPPRHSVDVNTVVLDKELPKPPELAKPDKPVKPARNDNPQLQALVEKGRRRNVSNEAGTSSLEMVEIPKAPQDDESKPIKPSRNRKEQEPVRLASTLQDQEGSEEPLLIKGSLGMGSLGPEEKIPQKKLEPLEVEDPLSNHKVSKSLTGRLKSTAQRISNFFITNVSKFSFTANISKFKSAPLVVSIFSIAYLNYKTTNAVESIEKSEKSNVLKFFSKGAVHIASRLGVVSGTVFEIGKSLFNSINETARRVERSYLLTKVELIKEYDTIENSGKYVTLKKVAATGLAALKFLGRSLVSTVLSPVSAAVDVAKLLTLGLFFIVTGPTGAHSDFEKKSLQVTVAVGTFFGFINRNIEKPMASDKDIDKAQFERAISKTRIESEKSYISPQEVKDKLMDLKIKYVVLSSKIEDNERALESNDDPYSDSYAKLKKIDKDLRMEREVIRTDTMKYLSSSLQSQQNYTRSVKEEVELSISFVKYEQENSEKTRELRLKIEGENTKIGKKSRDLALHEYTFNAVLEGFYKDGNADYLGDGFNGTFSRLRDQMNSTKKSKK